MAENDPITYLDEEDQKRIRVMLELREAGLANGAEMNELKRLNKKAIYLKHGLFPGGLKPDTLESK